MNSTTLPTVTKSLISVSGKEAAKFLQGLITNDIFTAKTNNPIYTGFLNSKGRYLFDGYIHRGMEAKVDLFSIEVDSRIKPDFISHLKKYSLRNEFVQIKETTDSSQEEYLPVLPNENNICTVEDFQQNRRLVHTCRISPSDSSHLRYLEHRFRLGIPEGSREITQLPLECNLDLLHGINTSKGCYLGQELTIRTLHTGVIRKRIVPIKTADGSEFTQEALDIPLYADSSPLAAIGKVLAIFRNRALALVRLEDISSGSGKSLLWQQQMGIQIEETPGIVSFNGK